MSIDKSYYYHGRWKCPICGSKMIYDPHTNTIVCPNCGYVLEDALMVPSYKDLEHAEVMPKYADVIVRLENPDDAARKAETYLEDLTPEERRVIRMFMRSLAVPRRVRVEPPSEEVAKKLAAAEREDMVYRKIVELASNCEDANPDEVFEFAKRYKHLWSGRKAEAIAKIFLYIYSYRRGKRCRFKLSPKLRKTIQAYMRLLGVEPK